jgi:hypothetical protein
VHSVQESLLNGSVFRGSGAAAGLYAYVSANNSELAAYHAEMRRKYENAAVQPWLVIEPDPPPP